MAHSKSEPADLRTLVGAVADDAKTLIAQQGELLRVELGGELRRVGGAAASVAAGAGLAAAGGLLGGMAVAHLVRRATGLPLWAGYGLVGGAAAVGAAALLARGKTELEGVRPLPQSVAALGENLTWLKDRLTTPAG